MKKFQVLVDKAIQNIEEDRAAANKMLVDLLVYMQKTGDTAHQSMGHVAAQYLETLQRSNEQLVKITSLLQRQEGGAKGLTSSERDNIFDRIKEG
jgi:hypothetical protein